MTAGINPVNYWNPAGAARKGVKSNIRYAHTTNYQHFKKHGALLRFEMFLMKRKKCVLGIFVWFWQEDGRGVNNSSNPTSWERWEILQIKKHEILKNPWNTQNPQKLNQTWKKLEKSRKNCIQFPCKTCKTKRHYKRFNGHHCVSVSTGQPEKNVRENLPIF